MSDLAPQPIALPFLDPATPRNLYPLYWKARILGYRIARRFSTATECGLFGAACSDVAGPELPDEFRSVILTHAETGRSEFADAFRSVDFRSAIRANDVAGIGIVHREVLAGHIWLHANYVPGKHNQDGDPKTALPLTLSPTTLYLFNAFVAPEFRGKRLYATMVRIAAEEALRTGYEQIVLTTEVTNQPALKSVKRMGFRCEGITRLLCLGPIVRADYPSNTKSNVAFGKFAGDSRRT